MAAVLVTGGLGVIGAGVTRRLFEQNISVITYSRNVDTLLIKDIADKVICVSGDILDLPKLIHTIKENNIDRIIHLSALMPGPLQENPYETYRVNIDGTMNVLEAAKLMNIKRLVYTSTQSVYDKTKGRHGHPSYEPIDEDYPKNPRDVYGVTKLFGEGIGLCYHQIYGVDFIAIRFAWVYGPGKQLRHGPLAIHSRLIESAMLGKNLTIPQGADQISDNVYLSDVTQGIVLACFAEKTQHRIFNIGTGTGQSFGELAETVNRICEGPYVQIGPGLDPLQNSDGNYMVMSIERARKELGYRPEFDWETGVKHYIETMKRLDIEPIAP